MQSRGAHDGWDCIFFLVWDFIRLFPCAGRGICCRLGGSFTANILHLLWGAALKMSKSSRLQPARATCSCRTSVLTSLLHLWISSQLPPPQHFDEYISFRKANLWEESRHHTRLVLGTDWIWTFQCCYGNEMRSRCAHIPHLAASHPICWRSANCHFSQNWPACPNFLFHSVSNYIFSRPRLLPTFVPPPLAPPNDEVTLPGELRSLRRKAPILIFVLEFFWVCALMVWVKSPLTEITERCLLGPALLKLPHRELALVFLSHFTLGRYLHSGFSQIVPVQRAGPAARLICRILRELRIHPTVGVFLTKKYWPTFYGTACVFPEGNMVFTWRPEIQTQKYTVWPV